MGAKRALEKSLAAGLLLSAPVACGGPDVTNHATFATSLNKMTAENALNPNALNPNALNPNALNPNALNPNALEPTALALSAWDAIQLPDADGARSREFIKYTVSCALTADKTFDFTWTDADSVQHHESYEGLLGLAPDWASGALDAVGAQWVSACLASRVNWYSTVVTISSRGGHSELGASSTEISNYDWKEGAFYGNLFQENPLIAACHFTANDSHSRASYRDCAAGHIDGSAIVPCGALELAGDCDDKCTGWSSTTGYYANCKDSEGVEYSRPITVWLD